MIILDTNVLSELMRPTPAAQVSPVSCETTIDRTFHDLDCRGGNPLLVELLF
jgi:hypothetical protein